MTAEQRDLDDKINQRRKAENKESSKKMLEKLDLEHEEHRKKLDLAGKGRDWKAEDDEIKTKVKTKMEAREEALAAFKTSLEKKYPD